MRLLLIHFYLSPHFPEQSHDVHGPSLRIIPSLQLILSLLNTRPGLRTHMLYTHTHAHVDHVKPLAKPSPLLRADTPSHASLAPTPPLPSRSQCAAAAAEGGGRAERSHGGFWRTAEPS